MEARVEADCALAPDEERVDLDHRDLRMHGCEARHRRDRLRRGRDIERRPAAVAEKQRRRAQ